MGDRSYIFDLTLAARALHHSMLDLDYDKSFEYLFKDIASCS
jgi:hypothetical protein